MGTPAGMAKARAKKSPPIYGTSAIRERVYLEQGICPHCCARDVMRGKTRCLPCARRSTNVARVRETRIRELETRLADVELKVAQLRGEPCK